MRPPVRKSPHALGHRAVHARPLRRRSASRTSHRQNTVAPISPIQAPRLVVMLFRRRIIQAHMTTESAIVTEAPIPQSPSSPHPRLRIPFILLSLYWLVILVTYLTEIPTFNRFLLHMGALLVVILVFLIWWSFNRSIPRRDRLHILAAAIVAPVFTMLLADKTMGPMPLFNGLP